MKYLGVGFYKDARAKEWKCRLYKDSIKKLKKAQKLKNQKIIYKFRTKNVKSKLCNQRGGNKLFCIKINENNNDRHRRSFAYKASNYLETMESYQEAIVEIAKARNRKRLSETNIIHRKSLLMDSYKNLCDASNLKRETITRGTCKLFGLL